MFWFVIYLSGFVFTLAIITLSKLDAWTGLAVIVFWPVFLLKKLVSGLCSAWNRL
jgi:hypothetical protein